MKKIIHVVYQVNTFVYLIVTPIIVAGGIVNAIMM